MTVRKIFVDNQLFEIQGSGYESKGNFYDKKGNKVDTNTYPDLIKLLET